MYNDFRVRRVEAVMGGELARVVLGNATFYRVRLAPATLGQR